MYGLSKFFPQPEKLLQNTAVDGSTATILGLSCFDQEIGLDEEDEDGAGTLEDYGFHTSPPRITNNRKRGSNTTDTASSPSKNSNKKVLINVIMQGLITQLENAADKEVKALKEISQSKKGKVSQAKQAKIDDVARCLNMAVEAGAHKASHEYYVATMLFRSSYNRLVFSNFDTNEQMMAWLQRATQQG
jgi:hypothetical protein